MEHAPRHEQLPNTDALGKLAVDEATRQLLHDKLDEAIDELNIDPSTVRGVRLSRWESITKDADGEAQTHPLTGFQFQLGREDLTPAWPVVQRCETNVHPLPRSRERIRRDHKVAMIFPDTQIGYRTYSDGTVDPFHDEEAISVALQIMAETRPDKVVFIGDFLDLPEQSKYAQTPEFARGTQLAVDYGHALLATIRATLPKADIIVLEGNHDKRLEDFTKRNAMASVGVKRASDTTGWPVLSVPYLLAFDQLGVDYVGGYPAGRHYITPQLQVIHGHLVRSGANTARAVSAAESVSTIFGHIHRIEQSSATHHGYEGGRSVFAYTPGTLSRIDGAVPSVKGGTTLDGRPVLQYENWQQGCALVEYDETTGNFNYHQVHINTFNDYETRLGGQTFRPRTDLVPKVVRR